MNDQNLLILSVIVCCSFGFSLAVELTFELPDNAKDCFYEEVPVGTKATVEFQVVTGGHYDVDMILTGPSGNVIYKNTKQQYDSVTWTADIGGIHKVCFSNEFSTISHKIVYLDFQVGDERPLLPDMGMHATAMTQTQMESSTVKIHESMKDVIDYQTHFRLREAQGRKFAEDLNERVFMWSIGQSVVILIVGIGQVLVLKNFFTEKKNISGSI